MGAESDSEHDGRPARPIILGWYIPYLGVLVVALSCAIESESLHRRGTEVALTIERKDGNNGSFREIATLPAKASAFTDSGIVPGKVYYYRAGAVTADGTISYSPEMAARAHTE